MLGAAAAIVLTAGGAGLFGPLGSLISGGAPQGVTEEDHAGDVASPVAAIVAAPARGAAIAAPGAGPGRRGSGRGAPGGRRGPASGPSFPGIPGTGTPGGPGGGGAPPSGGGGGNGGAGPRPPSGGGAVQAVADTVAEVGRQAPAPVRPITDELTRVTGGLTDTCRRLPVCP